MSREQMPKLRAHTHTQSLHVTRVRKQNWKHFSSVSCSFWVSVYFVADSSARMEYQMPHNYYPLFLLLFLLLLFFICYFTIKCHKLKCRHAIKWTVRIENDHKWKNWLEKHINAYNNNIMGNSWLLIGAGVPQHTHTHTTPHHHTKQYNTLYCEQEGSQWKWKLNCVVNSQLTNDRWISSMLSIIC